MGIFATGLVIGGIAIWLIYQNQNEALASELIFEVELQTMALDSEVSRLIGIATQITSRTQIRDELEKYNRREIDLPSLIAFTRPKLEDPLHGIQDLKGITRIDPRGALLVEVGEPIAKPLWPRNVSTLQPSLGIPQSISENYRFAISAPILNRNGVQVGTDIVLVDHTRLNELMGDFYRKNPSARAIFLATIEESNVSTFLAFGARPDRVISRPDLIRILLASRKVGLIDAPGADSDSPVIVHKAVGDSGWAFVLIGDAPALYGSAVDQARFTALTILALILAGSWLTYGFIRPLTRNLDEKTERLVTSLDHNRALLEEMQTKEALVQSVLDNTPSVIYIKDRVGRYRLVNIAYEKFSKFKRGEIIGKTDHELFPAEIADKFRINDLKVIDGDHAIEVDEQAPHEDGIHDYLSVKFPLHDPDGRVNAICGISNDITDRKAAENRLRQSAKVFESSGEGLVITAPDGTIVDVNPAFSEIMGFDKAEVVGRNPRLWKSDRHSAEFFKEMWCSIEALGQWRGEIWNRRKDGSLIPELLTIKSVLDDKGCLLNYVAVYSDISKIKQSQAELEYLAHHDPLTDLPNRILFNARLEHAIDRAQRKGSGLAVVFLDLDQFKNINDSLGHCAGDQLLTRTAELLKRQLRKTDTVARIGGDEFTFLVEDIFDSDDVILTVEKILRAFDSEFLIGEHRIRITSSLGISVYPEDGDDAESLLRNADSAMYRAKREGGNTYQFYTEALTIHALEHARFENQLRKAIENQEFSLHYQPQIDFRNGRIVGMEALVRWSRPGGGIVLPDTFIAVAENCGVIRSLDEWVMATACRQAKIWLDQGLAIGTLAVNISGRHIDLGGFSKRVEMLLEAVDFPAEHLEIEITESFIMSRSERAIEELIRLHALGVRLAVDDFGIGDSSLTYLQTLPINRLKIDQSLIRDIPDDADDVAITRAIVALGTSLELELVAEGVETSQQRDFLVGIGCKIGQGYLFCRPVSAQDMRSLLQGVPDTPAPDV
ncbi:MAG: EAL domain-containing protein [Methylococcales bacterium]